MPLRTTAHGSDEWQQFVLKIMAEKELSQVALAKLLSKTLRRRVTQGAVQSRLKNPLNLPPDEIEVMAWSKALGLSVAKQKRCAYLALLGRTPPAIRLELQRLKKRIGTAKG